MDGWDRIRTFLFRQEERGLSQAHKNSKESFANALLDADPDWFLNQRI